MNTMNQEQNNLNQNNLNTQGNNGIPNHQPLQNNQGLNNTVNQNVNVNQPTLNSQPQVDTNDQQPINNNLNFEPPKKNNKLFIIIGAILLIIVAGIILYFVMNQDKKDSNNNPNANINENLNNNNENSNEVNNDDNKTNNIDLVYTFKDPSKPVAFDYPNLKSIEEGTSQIFKNSKYVIAYSREEKNAELKDIPMQLLEKFKYITRTHIEGTCASISVEETKEMKVNETSILEIKGHIISEYDDGTRLNLPMKGYTFKKEDTIFQLIGFINEEANENNQKEMEDTIDAMIKTLRDDR